jgi:hypothetical protein
MHTATLPHGNIGLGLGQKMCLSYHNIAKVFGSGESLEQAGLESENELRIKSRVSLSHESCDRRAHDSFLIGHVEVSSLPRSVSYLFIMFFLL